MTAHTKANSCSSIGNNFCGRHGRLYSQAQIQTGGTSLRFLIGITFVFWCGRSSPVVDTMKLPAPHDEKQTTTIAIFSIRFTGELRFAVGISVGMLR